MKRKIPSCLLSGLLFIGACKDFRNDQIAAGSEFKNQDSVAEVNNSGEHLKKQTDSLVPVNSPANDNGSDLKERIIQFAETLVGTPYRYGSTDPKVGFDCSGFITYVFNHFKISVPRSSIGFTDEGKAISESEAERGDIILFTGTNPQEKFVGHMGLIVSNDGDELKFIHSTSGKAMSVTITPLNDYYRTRLVGFRRLSLP